MENVYSGPAAHRRTVAGRIVEELSHEIRMGSLKPGERLPSEKGLGQRFGAGRSSVREALQILSGRGLVDTRAGRGTFVADFSAPEIDSMTNFWDSRHQVALGHVVETRLALEPWAAAMAAARADGEGLEQVGSTLEQMEDAVKADSLSGRVFADIAFHDRVFAAAGNPLYRSIYRGIEPLLFDVRRMGLRSSDRAQKVLEAHSDIYEALVKKEPDRAAERMCGHILEFVSDTKVELGQEPLAFARHMHAKPDTGKPRMGGDGAFPV